MSRLFTILAVICLMVLPVQSATACGEVDRDHPGLGYLYPTGDANYPMGAVPVFEQMGSGGFSRSDRSLPYGTEVQVLRRMLRSDGTAEFAAIRVVVTGKETFVPISAIAPFRFWECSPEELYRTTASTSLPKFSLLPMTLAKLDAVGADANGERTLKVADVTAGREILCNQKPYIHGSPDLELMSCLGNKVNFNVALSAMRIMSPDELGRRMPSTALTHGGCNYHRADGFQLQSAVGEVGYLLTELAWASSGPRNLFEMVAVYKRTGPILFEKMGFLPYGSEVSIEEFIPTYTQRGMYRVKEKIEGQEYFVNPKDIQLYPFWTCDLKAMLEDHYIHGVPRFVGQLPVQIVNRTAVAIDYPHGSYVDPLRLAKVEYAWCDLYDPRPDANGLGQKSTRCQSNGLSFTIDASALQVIDPHLLSKDL